VTTAGVAAAAATLGVDATGLDEEATALDFDFDKAAAAGVAEGRGAATTLDLAAKEAVVGVLIGIGAEAGVALGVRGEATSAGTTKPLLAARARREGGMNPPIPEKNSTAPFEVGVAAGVGATLALTVAGAGGGGRAFSTTARETFFAAFFLGFSTTTSF